MAVSPTARALRRVRGSTLRVAALSLVLVAGLEAVLVLSAAATGTVEGAGPFLVDLAQKVPWGVGVCTGLWMGLQVGHGRPLVAAAAGLVAAPIASLLLRAVAEGAHAMAIVEAPAGSPLAVAAVKGVEYACLGLLVAWLGRHRWARVPHYAAAGAAVAIPFGLVLLALTASGEPPPEAGAMVEWAVDEVLFPIGCALILCSAERATREAIAAGGA